MEKPVWREVSRRRLRRVWIFIVASISFFLLYSFVKQHENFGGSILSPLDSGRLDESLLRAKYAIPTRYIESDGSVELISLNGITESPNNAAENEEGVLLLATLRDAEPYLKQFLQLTTDLKYPHQLIDLAFLVSDSKDQTLLKLSEGLKAIQNDPKLKFRSATIIQKDFGAEEDQMNVEIRHKFEYQPIRRKRMAKARNYLLSAALKPHHSWVLWRDVDIVESPASIIEDFQSHDADIVVPNIYFHRFRDGVDIEGGFDYNSWIETSESRKFLTTLDKDVILAEGYPRSYDTHRKYMVKMGNRHENQAKEMHLDGIGGVTILVKAEVHRSGINFPAYPFENQAETEGFAKMANRAGYKVIGLPNYIVWHIDTEEKAEDH